MNAPSGFCGTRPPLAAASFGANRSPPLVYRVLELVIEGFQSDFVHNGPGLKLLRVRVLRIDVNCALFQFKVIVRLMCC